MKLQTMRGTSTLVSRLAKKLLKVSSRYFSIRKRPLSITKTGMHHLAIES